MGGAGRGARVVPTEESRTAPSSQPAAVFTPVVPVDHVADEPESGTFGPALADASPSSNADGQAYVSRPQGLMDCALLWLFSVLLWRLMHLGNYGFGCEPCDVLPCGTG
jgi:hypothetical protein